MPKLYKQIDFEENVGSTKYLSNFSGGLNPTDGNEVLKDNEATIRKNWGQDEKGAIKKVAGFTKANSTKIDDAAIRGLFRAYQSDGTTKLLAICNTKLYFSDDDGATFTQATSGTGLSATEFNSGVNYNDLFFFTNKTDNLQHYTPGTDTMAAATDQPAQPCKILLKRTDRRMLALVNDTTGPTLYYSKVDPTGAAADDWSASNDAGSISIDGAKSEPLTGGATFGAYDIIFKDYAAFKVWGYPAPQATKIQGSPGCAAPFSVAQGEGLCFFLSHDAVWMYDGNRFVKISKPIKSIIDSIRQGYIQNAFGVYRDGRYWLFYTASGDTTNKDCLVYDVEHSNPYNEENIWYERDGLSMNCPCFFNGVGDANELYAGTSQATGFVYRLDYSSTGADDTSDITGIYQTKYFDFDFPNLIKRIAKVKIRYYSAEGTLLVNWYTNRGNTTDSYSVATETTGTALGSFILGTSKLAGETETVVSTRLPDTAIGTDFSLKFTHTDSGVRPIIRSVEIWWDALYYL